MNKIAELKSVIGQEVSQNQSPTLRGKLLKVNKCNCIFEVVKSPYRTGVENRIGQRYLVPTEYAWNAFFF